MLLLYINKNNLIINKQKLKSNKFIIFCNLTNLLFCVNIYNNKSKSVEKDTIYLLSYLQRASDIAGTDALTVYKLPP